jgi:excinuclease ABC subunit B
MGDSIEIWPSYEEFAYRIEFWGDVIERIGIINPTTGEWLEGVDTVTIFPAKHFVTPEERIHSAVAEIRKELKEQLAKFESEGKLLEAQRLSTRTRYDLTMLEQTGHCPGIENYSRPLSGKPPGAPPDTLYSFFPGDFLLVIDESHVTVPQVRAMYAGDRSRKTTLVEHGFRLPSALDNRPLKFDEWEARCPQTIFVSATPAEYELDKTGGEVVEQLIRPTGLLDPIVEVLPARGQVGHLLQEIRQRIGQKERTLVTTLTKRLAEDLANYLSEQNVKCRWLHSELDAFERVELLQDLREGKCDVLVGVNLLREGLDLPEVSLVAILDADKEGFLRSETSLIQTIGRAARNANAKVLLYADTMTPSMQAAIDETRRRRKIQEEYNRLHGITPKTVFKAVHSDIRDATRLRKRVQEAIAPTGTRERITPELLKRIEKEMLEAAEELAFERAAELRDVYLQLKERIGEWYDPEEIASKPKTTRGTKGRKTSRGSRNKS